MMKSEEEMAVKVDRNSNELTIQSSLARTFFVRITSFEENLASDLCTELSSFY